MAKQVHTWKQAKDLIREQGYKHVALCDLHGKKVCSYNAISKGDKGLREKLAEIDTRMRVLSPGIYVLNCKTKYGNTSPEIPHYIGVGNYDANELSEGNTPTILHSGTPRSKNRASSENLTSVDTALEHVKTIAELEAENTRLRDKITQLEADKRELEAELDEVATMDEDGASNWFQPIAEGLFPVVDRYLDIREREGRREEVKTLLKAGYDLDDIFGGKIGGRASSRRSRSRSERTNTRRGRRQVPRPGEEGWDEFVDHVSELPDDEFETLVNQLRENDEEIYEALREEIEWEEDGELEESEEEQTEETEE